MSNKFTFPEHVLTQEEFYELIANNKRALHNYMIKNNKFIKIFICDKETDENEKYLEYLDETNEEKYSDDTNGKYLDKINYNCENKFFVAQLKMVKNGYKSSFLNDFWYGYHEVYSYGIDIYEMHKLDDNYNKLFIDNFFTCFNKSNTNSEPWMYNDFIIIYYKLKKLNIHEIETEKLKMLNEISRTNKINEINKYHDKILIDIDPYTINNLKKNKIDLDKISQFI